MTPDQTLKFNDMIRKVDEIYAWMKLRKVQQLSFPLDPVSQNAIKAIPELFKFVRPSGTVITETSRVYFQGGPGNQEYQMNVKKTN